MDMALLPKPLPMSFSEREVWCEWLLTVVSKLPSHVRAEIFARIRLLKDDYLTGYAAGISELTAAEVSNAS